MLQNRIYQSRGKLKSFQILYQLKLLHKMILKDLKRIQVKNKYRKLQFYIKMNTIIILYML